MGKLLEAMKWGGIALMVLISFTSMPRMTRLVVIVGYYIILGALYALNRRQRRHV